MHNHNYKNVNFSWVELLDFTNKSTWDWNEFVSDEAWIIIKYKSIPCYICDILKDVDYLKFKFNWVSCFLYANLTCGVASRQCRVGTGVI